MLPEKGVNTKPQLPCQAGVLRCVVSALRGKKGSTPAACDIFALALRPPPAGSGEPLAVLGVQLLQVPHMIPSPAAGSDFHEHGVSVAGS